MPTMVWALAWSDVDPTTHPFDPARALATIESTLAGRGLAREDERAAIEDDVDRALIAEHGMWAAGFRWAASEPGCGGPVRGWCCARDSLKGADAAVRLRDALVEFRSFLEELAERFERLRGDYAQLPIAEQLERAAAQLLPIIVERTDAQDAWYSTFARIMAWFVEPLISDPARASSLVDEAIGGRFRSWCAPDDAAARDVCRRLGHVVDEASAPNEIDALEQWLRIRKLVAWRSTRHYESRRVRRDGHLAYVDRVDAARDATRAARMREAIAAIRNAPVLDFETLKRAQTIVLGEEAWMRRTPAHAKHGRERYGMPPNLRSLIDDCLAEASAPSPHAIARAARAYLDMCFLHPFLDGNGRAARLALDWVLTRAGLALDAAEPIFVVSRSAGDEAGARSFEFVVDYLAGDA